MKVCDARVARRQRLDRPAQPRARVLFDVKLSEEPVFCHSRVGGNPEVRYFLVSVFLGSRLHAGLR